MKVAILDILQVYARIKYANIVGGNQLTADKEHHPYQVVTVSWEGFLPPELREYSQYSFA